MPSCCLGSHHQREAPLVTVRTVSPSPCSGARSTISSPRQLASRSLSPLSCGRAVPASPGLVQRAVQPQQELRVPLHKVHRQGSYSGSSTSASTAAPQMPEDMPAWRALRHTGLDACPETDLVPLSRPEHHHSPWQQPETVHWRSQPDEEPLWRPEPHHGALQQLEAGRGMFDSPSKPSLIADWRSRREEEPTKRLTGGVAARKVFLRKLTQFEIDQVQKLLLPDAERNLGELAAKEFDWALSSGGGVSGRGDPPGAAACIDLCSALTALRQLAYLNGLPSLDAEAARQCLESPMSRGVDFVTFKAALPKLIRSALAIEALTSQP